MMMNGSPEPHRQVENWRLYLFYGLIILVFIYYGARLFDYQVINGKAYAAQAEDNRTAELSVQTQRGVIYDRNGFVLARNIPSYNITITPAFLPADDGAVQEIYRQLSAVVDVPVSNGELTDETVRAFKECNTDFGITQIVYIADSLAPYEPVSIMCDVPEDVAMIVMEKAYDWPGTGVEIEPVREYPTGWMTSEIIGFLGPVPAALEAEYRAAGFVPGRDKVGYAGIENWFQEELGGTNGKRLVEVDVAGQVLRDIMNPVDPEPGSNLVLTIDTRLQMATKSAFLKAITDWNRYLNDNRYTNGVVIAMNPKTGEILSLVSHPTYENNRMARIIPAYYYEQLSNDPNRPLFNHAISAEHPPGSVFKLAPALGFMNERVLGPTDTINDPGKITVMQKYTPNDPGTPMDYVCYDDFGHGDVDFVHAIALSCDVYFYKLSGGYKSEVPEGLNVWRMAEYARAIGYGELTGIELPGEEEGLIPDPNWKRLTVGETWSIGDTYIASMGQGYVLSTPLQVLVSIATIANDGKYMKPTLLKEIQDAEGNVIQPFEPVMVRDITQDPVIEIYDENYFPTGEYKVVEPWVIELAKTGMRMVVEPGGTAFRPFEGMAIPSAGKTGSAEYCDNIAQEKGLCVRGSWPSHAWYVGYAPYDDPEIAVVAFVYSGVEGASVAGPIVRMVLEAYFELKAIDTAASGPQ